MILKNHLDLKCQFVKTSGMEPANMVSPVTHLLTESNASICIQNSVHDFANMGLIISRGVPICSAKSCILCYVVTL